MFIENYELLRLDHFLAIKLENKLRIDSLTLLEVSQVLGSFREIPPPASKQSLINHFYGLNFKIQSAPKQIDCPTTILLSNRNEKIVSKIL